MVDNDTHVQYVGTYIHCVYLHMYIRMYICMYLHMYQHARFSIMCMYTILEMCECTIVPYSGGALCKVLLSYCTCVAQLDYYLVCSQACNNSYSMVSTCVST